MSSIIDPLKFFEELAARDCGALFEGEIFARSHPLRYIIRAFEFALADGAIDCSYLHDRSSTYAKRLWDVDQRSRAQQASDLGLFDVKATLSAVPGSQIFITTKGQQRRVAFYICLSASNPDFFDLIPNLFQDPTALGNNAKSQQQADDNDLQSVNVTKPSRLPPSASRMLDPCGSPTRMPLAILPEALDDVRACMRDPSITYVNRWSGASFPKWKPLTTRNAQFLVSRDESAHHTSFAEIQTMFFRITCSRPKSLEMDLVGMQPRIGDFKLVVPGTYPPRQVFVQDKIDGRRRLLGDSLKKVSIARNSSHEGQTRYYFTALERFDFLCYHFDFIGDHQNTKELFFIPECKIPNEFYTTMETEGDFGIQDFRPFRLKVDSSRKWVLEVRKIIDEYPVPRLRGGRPHRREALTEAPEEGEDPSTTMDPERYELKSGTSLYKAIMAQRHHLAFQKVMGLCAQRKRGLMILTARNHPYGDFGYGRYDWTDDERDQYLRSNRPPKVLHELPQDYCIIPISYYTRWVESTHLGPNLSGPEFRRLASVDKKRLVLWDLFGPDAADPVPPVVIPSEDIKPSQSQKHLFLADQKRTSKPAGGPTKKDGPLKTPTVSALLTTGLYASAYKVHEGGPAVYSNHSWEPLLHLLDSFCSRQDSICHPDQIPRVPREYQHPLRDLNQCLADEFFNDRPTADLAALADAGDGM